MKTNQSNDVELVVRGPMPQLHRAYPTLPKVDLDKNFWLCPWVISLLSIIGLVVTLFILMIIVINNPDFGTTFDRAEGVVQATYNANTCNGVRHLISSLTKLPTELPVATVTLTPELMLSLKHVPDWAPDRVKVHFHKCIGCRNHCTRGEWDILVNDKIFTIHTKTSTSAHWIESQVDKHTAGSIVAVYINGDIARFEIIDTPYYNRLLIGFGATLGGSILVCMVLWCCHCKSRGDAC